MPGIDNVLSTSSQSSNTTNQPETTPLYLPSAITSSQRLTGCLPGIVDKERRLRLAQADDALGELRRQLRIASTIRDYKKAQIGSSQKLGTKTRSILRRFHEKTHRCARRYSAAFKALAALDPDGEWKTRLKVLDHAKDIRGPHRDEDDPSSEGTREMSWIWYASAGGGRPSMEAVNADEIGASKLLRHL